MDVRKPTYKRQQFLLSFVQQLQDGIYATELQKLVFLYTMETHSSYYDFVPYKFGPYSFQLDEDVQQMCRDRYFTRQWNGIVACGVSDAEPYPIARERSDRLIRKVYEEYPYYAINSEILDRIFSPQEAERYRDGRKAYNHSEQVLFTIGYEGRSIESFENTLIRNDVHVLVDVRNTPYSRKFGFSKSRLQHITETVKIRYIHIPELGIESEHRVSLETDADYEKLFESYAQTLPDRERELKDLYSILQENKRIALMCFERDPKHCHRHVLRDYLMDHYHVRSEDL